MDYRTILVHVNETARAEAPIRLAIALAERCGAHLIGLGTSGISRSLYPSLPPEQNDPTLALHLGFLREQAQAALAAFSGLCGAARLASFEARLVDDEAAAGISLHARTADLTVLSQADPQRGSLENLAAEVVLQAGRPVLLLPFATPVSEPGQRVLVAWDASREAARALQAALPLLRKARQVHVAVIDTLPPSHTSTDARCADPLPYLGRHGIAATMAVRAVDLRHAPQRRHAVGAALLSLASDLSADLLVMGAYAHSRMRETLLGGVTRTVFETMTIPVLMTH